MSEETQTPPQETNPLTQTENNFTTIDEMQTSDKWQKAVAEHARRIIEAQPLEPLSPSVRSKRLRFGAGVVIGATLATGGTIVAADHILPSKEIASATTSVQRGEGVEQSVYRDIAEIESKNIDPADTTERQDVTYQAVDIHSDANGIVQPGESVKVIAEKSQIFGNVTYKAVGNSQQLETK